MREQVLSQADVLRAFDAVVTVQVFVRPGDLPGVLDKGTWEEAVMQSLVPYREANEWDLRITCIITDKSLCRLHTALPFITIYGMRDAQERLRIP